MWPVLILRQPVQSIGPPAIYAESVPRFFPNIGDCGFTRWMNRFRVPWQSTQLGFALSGALNARRTGSCSQHLLGSRACVWHARQTNRIRTNEPQGGENLNPGLTVDSHAQLFSGRSLLPKIVGSSATRRPFSKSAPDGSVFSRFRCLILLL